MKKGQIGLVVVAAIFFTAIIGWEKAKGPAQALSLYIYSIDGKDSRGIYKGTGKIVCYPHSRKMDLVMREITYEKGPTESAAGTGTIANNVFTASISSNRVSPADIRKSASPVYSFKKLSTGMSTVLSGAMDRKFSKAHLYLKRNVKGRLSIGEEKWSLQSKKPIYETSLHKIRVTKNSWESVPITIKKPCAVYVRVSGNNVPRGMFIPKGKKFPKLAPLSEYDTSPMPVNRSKENPHALPAVYDSESSAVWVRYFSEKEVGKQWYFGMWPDRHSAMPSVQDFEISISVLDFPIPFPICNPWVNIDISPRTAAVGEPITITVGAGAFAGLDMYWWYGNNTGITNLDKAHIIGGNGSRTGSHSWTITIDAPGTYTFGANARDLLYWSEHGVPHQASEGCGLAYDTVTVLPRIRKSYSVAFIVLAPQGTDVSSAEFQGKLNRVEDIKLQLPAQFDRSTLGRGAVDVSYPTVVLTPPGPVYGLDQESQMWTFLRDTIADEFYGSHPDAFDFLAIYEAYPDKHIGSRHNTIKTLVAGFNIGPVDRTHQWGSAGRLQGVGLVTDINELPENYDFIDSDMHLLLHEVFGHQWGMYATYLSSGIHFEHGVESPNFTVLYGRPWRKVDETHFTTADIQDPETGHFLVTFHPWVLYVAGMMDRNEISSSLMKVVPDTSPTSRYDLVTTTGTYTDITLQSVTDDCGDRYDVAW